MSHVHPEGWIVGMEVCVVTTLYRHEPKIEIKKIAKIGRRWITLEGDYKPDRFDAQTRHLDGNGYTSPGRVYENRNHYEEEQEVNKLWAEFRNGISYKPPENVTVDRIRELMRELL